jgi:hypothetical protein
MLKVAIFIDDDVLVEIARVTIKGCPPASRTGPAVADQECRQVDAAFLDPVLCGGTNSGLDGRSE